MGSNGKCMSVLDFLICNESTLPLVEDHIIDDEREVTSAINTDHNICFSLLNVNYQKVEWQKAMARPQWDMKNINKSTYKSSLQANLNILEASRESEGRGNSPTRIMSHVS